MSTAAAVAAAPVGVVVVAVVFGLAGVVAVAVVAGTLVVLAVAPTPAAATGLTKGKDAWRDKRRSASRSAAEGEHQGGVGKRVLYWRKLAMRQEKRARPANPP